MKYKLLSIALFAIAMTACVKEQDPGSGRIDPNLEIPEYAYDKGIIRIKIKPESGMADRINVIQTRSGGVSTGIAELDAIAEELGATHVEPTFGTPPAKYEARWRKAGLHLWYEIYFDEQQPVTRAYTDFSSIDFIETVEYSLKVQRTGTGFEASTLGPVASSVAKTVSRISSGTIADNFTDERLAEQWHYYNDGTSLNGSVTGADINIFPAWEITTGHPDVIVAIIDEGIDITHEDLVGNIWINKAELNGVAGKDDDDNGYKDDINGWNFVRNSKNVTPGDGHGTHVSGTIAARNNNGIGVCGVAGGNGDIPGITLMSCQIFEGKTSAGDANIKRAVVYGCDNGAVISQNSWGYTWMGANQSIRQSDKEAIDYFIKYGGMDSTGEVQVGPMKGGIVIFASGNDQQVGRVSMPGAYSAVVGVASFGPNYRRAYYSNLGDWVDISAPGGDTTFGDNYGVLSTKPGNTYGFMQGTSMACPHVSGIAALVISRFGVDRPGFTPEMLRTTLLSSIRDVDIYSYNSSYSGMMGAGAIDAYKAVKGTGLNVSNWPPALPRDFHASWDFNSVSLTWSVTEDFEDGKASSYSILYGTKSISATDFDGNTPEGLTKETVQVGSKNIGDKLSLDINNLAANTTYNIAFVGYDSQGERSAAIISTGVTLPNRAPEMIEGAEFEDKLFEAEAVNSFALNLYDYITDDIDTVIDFEVASDKPSVATASVDGNGKLTVNTLTLGIATINIKATDSKGLSSDFSFKVVIRNGNVDLEMYPNPVSEYLYIRMGVDATVSVAIYNAAGTKVIEKIVDVTVLEPGRIDVKKLSSGNYTVVVVHNGKETKKNIIKL